MTFLHKSYRDYSKVQKSVLVTTNKEGLDDKEELKTVPAVNQSNNNYNIVSDSKIGSDNEKIEENFLQWHQQGIWSNIQDDCQC